MNSVNPDPDDAGLNRVLREWEVKTPLPPRFREGVWHRIENRGEPVNAWTLLWRRIGIAFAQPSLAAAYVGVLLLAGTAAGYWQAHAAREHVGETMSARYVQMVDPYQRMPH